MIDVDYNEYKETIAENMRLIQENHKLKEEIEKLNNIINELEEYSKDRYYEEKKLGHYARLNAYKDILDKLQELKGSDKE